MRNVSLLLNLFFLLLLFSSSCSETNATRTAKYEIPTRNHDLGYIPYDATIDNPDYIICDSTDVNSGRNRLRYIGGANKLRKEITSKFLYKQEYEPFTGYVVVRFLVNCKNESGRYRAESLALDFSSQSAPSDLLEQSIALIKSLYNWTKTAGNDGKKEYSKYINLKFNNGKIEHVLL